MKKKQLKERRDKTEKVQILWLAKQIANLTLKRYLRVLLQLCQVLLSCDFAGAVAGHVFGVGLAVNQFATGFLEGSGEEDEGALGAVGFNCEHRFSAEDAAKQDSVKAADQLSVLPDFDAVGVACLVKFLVGLNHLRSNPGAVLIGPFLLCAVFYDISKSFVYRISIWIMLEKFFN